MVSERIAAAGRLALALILIATVSCDKATDPPAPALTTVNVALSPSTITFGQTVTAAATGLDQNGASITLGTIAWSSATPAVATVNATTGVVTGVSAGTAQIVATVDGKTGQAMVTVNAPAGVKINEIESNGGTPDDWVELINPTAATIDISGWVLKDNDDTHAYTLPAGSTIAAGAYFVLETGTFGFGLGSPDAVRLFNQYGVVVESYSWTPHATTTYGRCPNATGAFTTTTSSTKGAVNDCSVPVRVNEVESSGGTPGDWIEFFNPSPNAVDLSGFIVKDNDDTHSYAIPAATTIAAGGYLVVEEAALGFGLGQPDAARLFTPTGTLVDSYDWTTHATTTYGRCPDGTGAFATTLNASKGAANVCAGGSSALPWPGSDDATTVDGVSVFGSNLSGLTYEGSGSATPGVLWAVRNGPGTLYRMVWNGTIWTPDPDNGWVAGKALHYTDGLGNPDSEGVTYAAAVADGIYVATERNNDASTVSRSSILRFDPSGSATSLTALNDWNLTADLPVVGANLGIETVTWIPDAFLTSKSFYDETAAHAYNPAEYPNHGTGLFFVGVEANGIIYAYALNHTDNTFTRIATIATGFTGVMGSEFDRELGYFWAICDDGCGGLSAILEIDQTGGASNHKFVVTHQFNRPSSMPNLNNEGFAIAPQSECVSNRKPAYWSDDGETGGHSIRRAGVPCTAFP